MILKTFVTAAAVGLVAGLAAPAPADARSGKERRPERHVARDCKPYNGPFGYYGNPWCEGGWKSAEDYPPGTGPYYDLFDLPQIQRLRRHRY